MTTEQIEADVSEFFTSTYGEGSELTLPRLVLLQLRAAILCGMLLGIKATSDPKATKADKVETLRNLTGMALEIAREMDREQGVTGDIA